MSAAVAHIEAVSAPTTADVGDSIFIQIPNFLSPAEVARYEAYLAETPDWKAGDFASNKTPRMQKWFQDDARYFSKNWMNQEHERWKSSPAEEWLVELRARIQATINKLFESQIDGVYKGCRRPNLNSTLINYYRDGNDYIRYHKDDEKVFGDNPTIAMLTFGVPRELKFKWTPVHPSSAAARDHENDKAYKVEPGTLFLMAGSVQKCYWHGVERDASITDPRFSLTFREHID